MYVKPRFFLAVMLIPLAFWLWLPFPSPVSAEVYQCRDNQGGTVFSDEPCAPGQTQERVISDEELDYSDTLTVHDQSGETQKQLGAEQGEYRNTMSFPAEPVNPAAIPPKPADSANPAENSPPQTIKTLGGYRSPWTFNELVRLGERYWPWLLIYFCVPPLLALLLWPVTREIWRAKPPLSYLYSLLVYLVAIPGVFSLILLGYSVFFLHQNLLEVNALFYFLPGLSMLMTLIIIGRSVSFGDLPAVDHIIGLITVLGITFLAVLFIYKTRIFIGFFGSIETLILLAVGVFILLKWGLNKLFN